MGEGLAEFDDPDEEDCGEGETGDPRARDGLSAVTAECGCGYEGIDGVGGALTLCVVVVICNSPGGPPSLSLDIPLNGDVGWL
jgi:hypothetical protein